MPRRARHPNLTPAAASIATSSLSLLLGCWLVAGAIAAVPLLILLVLIVGSSVLVGALWGADHAAGRTPVSRDTARTETVPEMLAWVARVGGVAPTTAPLPVGDDQAA
jgi:hypothetical protein